MQSKYSYSSIRAGPEQKKFGNRTLRFLSGSQVGELFVKVYPRTVDNPSTVLSKGLSKNW